MSAPTIPGFDYATMRAVSMTPKQWREKYSAAVYRREARDGETFYYRRPGGMAAEAYAIIPAGRPSK